jgi:hypothetical protein
MGSSGLESLVGKTVNGVCFVMDYVELTFDGPILRALVDPVLSCREKTLVFPAPGSRDALCSLIGATVVSVNIVEGWEIRLVFSGDVELALSLDPAKRVGPEAVNFVPEYNSPIEVW